MSKSASSPGDATGCDHTSRGPVSVVAAEEGVGGAPVVVGGAPVAFGDAPVAVGDASVARGLGVGDAEPVAAQATPMTTEAIATASPRERRGLNAAKADECPGMLDLAEMPRGVLEDVC